MQREIGRLDPYSLQPRTGVIGRINDVLSTKGFSVDSFSVDADLRILEGKLANITKIAIGGKEGLVGLHPTDDDGMILHHANSLNGEADGYNSVFSETWSEEWVCYLNEDSDVFEKCFCPLCSCLHLPNNLRQ